VDDALGHPRAIGGTRHGEVRSKRDPKRLRLHTEAAIVGIQKPEGGPPAREEGGDAPAHAAEKVRQIAARLELAGDISERAEGPAVAFLVG